MRSQGRRDIRQPDSDVYLSAGLLHAFEEFLFARREWTLSQWDVGRYKEHYDILMCRS